MPGQPSPAAARLGGPMTRRYAALLLQSGIDGGGGVKDLRIHRVVPPVSAYLDTSSTECAADGAAKPVPVESTPPKAVSSVAAAEDPERKPVLLRTELVRNLCSFGYRRLLPFLNQMAKNDDSNCMGMPSEHTTVNSERGLKRSRSRLIDESVGEGYRDSDMEPAELVVMKTEGGPETKHGCDSVGEETTTFPRGLAGSKPWLNRCARSRIVHHRSSFSYKRMLPFLMENEIFYQEGGRVKFRRVAEETPIAPDQSAVLTSEKHHLPASKDSSNEFRIASIENMEEEKASNTDGSYVPYNQQLQSAVPKASSPEYSAAEVHNVIRQETCTLNQDPLSSYEGESKTDGIDFLAGGQYQLPVSEDSTEEHTSDVDITIVQDKALKSDGSFGLEPAISEGSYLENSTPEGKMTTEQSTTSDTEEGNTLASDKAEFHIKEKPQLRETKELLTAQVEDTAEFPQVPQCQSSVLGCRDVGFGSSTKTLLTSISLEHQGTVDDPHLDTVLISRPSDPCGVDGLLSMEEMSGSVSLTESVSRKVGILKPSEALSFGKCGPSPKKLSPRKGILKRHTRGCKGICMCLDCSTYRLHANRAFEFSRKQMQEADDIIGNLLREMANLRSLVEKPAAQRESVQAACHRALRVEEVARDRCHQMFVDLNSHCRIPGPRVRFTQYVEENLCSSPHSSEVKEDNIGSSPSSSSFRKRRCMKA